MKKLFDVPDSYKEHITKFDSSDGFLALGIIVTYFVVMTISGIIVQYISQMHHYYRWRNQCVLIDSLVIQTDANSKQVADFALITFVQSLNLTDNQRHELISLLDDKYRVSSIMAIAAGNLSI